MFPVSNRTVTILAGVVWYTGGLVLLLKGSSLLLEAGQRHPDNQSMLYLTAAAALVLGSIKATYLFSQNCRKNLARIAALEHPRLWQCYRPWFLIALACMIVAGAILSRMAHDHYRLLLLIALLDLSIATALLISSVAFWKR